MLTRKAIYEAHGFFCAPNYKSFNKTVSDGECIELTAVLDMLKKREHPREKEHSLAKLFQ